MAETDISALDLIRVGQNSLILLNPAIWDVKCYAKAVTDFITFARKCRLNNCVTAASSLEGRSISYFYANRQIHPGEANALASAVRSIEAVLNEEAKTTGVLLSNIEPPDNLTALTNLQPHQEALLQDLVVCIKAGLARPAIVMAWALGFDLVRTWVFEDKDRLDAFNKQFKKKTVSSYEESFEIGDSTFLETCQCAGDALQPFTSKTFRTLQRLLDHRNEFAHANYSKATPNRAAAFVEEIVSVVTGPPFK